MSPNWVQGQPGASSHGNNQQCNITVQQNGTLTVTQFNVFSATDKLCFGSNKSSCWSYPSVIDPTTYEMSVVQGDSLTWSSGNVVNRPTGWNWRLCLVTAAPPTQMGACGCKCK